jgi:hypothetical protein
VQPLQPLPPPTAARPFENHSNRDSTLANRV